MIVQEISVLQYSGEINKVIGNNSGQQLSGLHFNSINFESGRELHLYNSVGVVFDRDARRVVFCSKELNSPHDMLSFGGGLFINSSNNNETLFFKGDGVTSVFKSSETSEYTGFNSPGYTRGLHRDGNSLFIGVSPVIISEIDINTLQHKNSFLISDNCNEVIYDICQLT